VATVEHWLGSWAAAPDLSNAMQPGQVLSFKFWGFAHATVVTVSPAPIGIPAIYAGNVLAIENQQFAGDEADGTRWMSFDVRNVGTNPAFRFDLAFSLISP
jgi:hypothetical protein